MAEDLTTAPEEIPEEETSEVEIEFTSRAEIIASCYNAIGAVEGIDTEVLGSEQYGKMKRRIIKRSIKILDTLVKEMYDETFFEEDEKEEGS